MQGHGATAVSPCRLFSSVPWLPWCMDFSNSSELGGILHPVLPLNTEFLHKRTGCKWYFNNPKLLCGELSPHLLLPGAFNTSGYAHVWVHKLDKGSVCVCVCRNECPELAKNIFLHKGDRTICLAISNTHLRKRTPSSPVAHLCWLLLLKPFIKYTGKSNTTNSEGKKSFKGQHNSSSVNLFIMGWFGLVTTVEGKLYLLWKEKKRRKKIYKSQSVLSFFPSFPRLNFLIISGIHWMKWWLLIFFDDKLPAVHVGLITRWHISFCHLYKLILDRHNKGSIPNNTTFGKAADLLSLPSPLTKRKICNKGLESIMWEKPEGIEG